LTVDGTWHRIQKMVSIGQDLKKERELRGISLEEISGATKINPRFLQALEDDQFDTIPGKFFVRGIIREYTKYLGLEEYAVLDKYAEAIQSEKQELNTKKKWGTSLPKNIKTALGIAALGAVLISVLTGLFFIFGNHGSSRPPVKPEPQVTIREKKDVPPVKTQEMQKTEEKKVEELNLEFIFLQDTWIQIFADGEKIYSGIRLRGGKFQAKAKKEVVIDLGNAGGLTYTINGKAGIPFGKSGSVEKNIRITLENCRQFLAGDDDSEEEDTAGDSLPDSAPGNNGNRG